MSHTMACVLCEEVLTTRFSCLITSLLLIAMFTPGLLAAGDKTKTESCEYDLDMSSKKVRIVCQGSPSMVNVYATSAHVESSDGNKNNNNFAENAYDKHVLNIEKGVPSFMHPQSQHSQDIPRRESHLGQQLHPPERMTFPESENLSVQEAVDEGEERENLMPRFRGAFTDAMLNVSDRLQDTKQNLSSCGAAIRNISTLLGQGDVVLKPDTDNLRRINNSVTDLKEGIILALRNRYNFMSDILVTRSYELEKLAATTSNLMEVTVDGLNSALTANKQVMEEVSTLHDLLRRLRKRLSKEITRHEYMQREDVDKMAAGQCSKEISAIGRGTSKDMQLAAGSYMVQSFNPKEHRSIFIMADTGPSSELREYYSSAEIDYNLVGKNFPLLFSCSGTGHAVYRRHFYCHKTDTNLIVKYNLKRSQIVSELALTGARFGNTQPYTSNNDIDLAVDELGLWAVYATDASSGDIVVAKIDHKKMEIEKTWPTTIPKRQVGNVFMICGTLYATNSHSDTPTFIRYMYRTDTEKEQYLDDGVVPLANSASLGHAGTTPGGVGEKPTNSFMLSYNSRISSLSSWNNGRVDLFPVYFRESA